MTLLALLPASAGADEWCSPLQVSIVSGVRLVAEYRTVCGLSLNLPAGGQYKVRGLDVGILSGASQVVGAQVSLIASVTTPSDSFAAGVRGVQIAGGLNWTFGSDFKGAQIAGLANLGHGTGLQAALLMNWGEGDLLQVAAVNDHEGDGRLVQVGAVNSAGAVHGVQVGVYNSGHVLRGAQVGIVNRSLDPRPQVDPRISALAGGSAGDEPSAGIQIGVVNTVRALRGTQVGIVNRAGSVRGIQVGIVNSADELHGVQIGLANFIGEGGLPFMPVMNWNL